LEILYALNQKLRPSPPKWNIVSSHLSFTAYPYLSFILTQELRPSPKWNVVPSHLSFMAYPYLSFIAYSSLLFIYLVYPAAGAEAVAEVERRA